MGRLLKVGFFITGVIIIIVGRFLWIWLGNPYPRLHLIGTEYIEGSDELGALNRHQGGPYLLIKKYNYSKDVWLIGFGGGSSSTDDYYSLGISDSDEKEIIPPKYEFLYAVQDYKTKKIYIHCVPYRKTGHEPEEYYRIENNKAVLLENKVF